MSHVPQCRQMTPWYISLHLVLLLHRVIKFLYTIHYIYLPCYSRHSCWTVCSMSLPPKCVLGTSDQRNSCGRRLWLSRLIIIVRCNVLEAQQSGVRAGMPAKIYCGAVRSSIFGTAIPVSICICTSLESKVGILDLGERWYCVWQHGRDTVFRVWQCARC